jgi:acyl-CoA thioesterase FadM
MDFMRDAFPFDRIRLEMHARAVTESAATLQFVFYRIAPDGLPERLAVGEQDVIWVRRTANGSPAPAPFPEEIRRAFEGG